ncbi:glycosyltransferase [Fibrella aquatilis]|uniref:Glycosyltransferase n=1 Tax=Fibrella aquatilis TaxID=2817059 RepID=A0A939G6Z9_9BACT|nr:glycosyltransferase [Fibrella aquatilis]MBO0930948.1 glycosyltransferase [Fibrella aquatilis]
MYSPYISIIITVLNGEKTIRECLLSIANQTFPDYELVIVDGGSEDRTVSIIGEYTIINKTVRIIPGIGLYAGLNTGISLSTGKWLYFIGADDELHTPNTLHAVANFIRSGEASTKIFVGSVECVKQEIMLRPLFGSPHLMRHQVHHQGMFYDRQIFDKLLYNESMRIASDYEFNLKLSLMNIPHQSMDIVVCNFGGDGISENQMQQGYSEMQQIHSQLFSGWKRTWAMGYFWLRRKTGAVLRKYNLLKISKNLKDFFG